MPQPQGQGRGRPPQGQAAEAADPPPRRAGIFKSHVAPLPQQKGGPRAALSSDVPSIQCDRPILRLVMPPGPPPQAVARRLTQHGVDHPGHQRTGGDRQDVHHHMADGVRDEEHEQTTVGATSSQPNSMESAPVRAPPAMQAGMTRMGSLAANGMAPRR